MQTTAASEAAVPVDASRLDASIDGIMFNFFLRDQRAFPWMRKKRPTVKEARPPGAEAVPLTEEVSLVKFFEDLTGHGFVLKNGFMQGVHPDKGQNAANAKFIFDRRRPSPDAVENLQTIVLPALVAIVDASLWTVQGWRNQLHNEPDCFGWGFRCGDRVPILDSRAKPAASLRIREGRLELI
jgi:hypothetical protein